MPGPWEKYGGGGAGAQGVPIGLQDPTMDLKRPQAEANVTKTLAEINNATRRANVDEANSQRQFQATLLDAKRNGYVPDGKGGWVRDPNYRPPGPELTPAVRQQALTDFTGATEIAPVIEDIEQKFRAGPGKTSGPMGALDFLPLEGNQNFNSAANKLRGFVKQAQGFTGGEGNTLGEAQMNIGAFIPKASDYDSTTSNNINALRGEQRKAFKNSIAVLGGIPDANGKVTPVPQGYEIGQYPELDMEIVKQLSTVPDDRRQSYILAAKRRFEERRQARVTPPRKAGSKANTTWYGTPRSAPRKGAQSRVIDFNDLPE